MFTPEQSQILDRLAIIPFYPADHHRLVIQEVYEFAAGAPSENLTWLVKSAVRTMRKWSGVPELRGLWCSRFKPADGIEGETTAD